MEAAQEARALEYRLSDKERPRIPTYRLLWFLVQRGLVSLHWYVAALVISVVQVGLQFLSPIPSAIIVGSILPMIAEKESSSFALISCCLAWVVIRLVTAAVGSVYSYITSEGSLNLMLHLRGKFLGDLERLSSEHKERFGIGRLYTTYATDLTYYSQFYTDFLPQLCRNLILVFGTFGIIYLLSPCIFWLLLFAIPAQLVLMSFFQWRIQNLHRQVNRLRDEAMTLFNEALINDELIKSFDAQERIVERTLEKVVAGIEEYRHVRNRTICWNILSSTVSIAFSIGIALLTGLQVIDGDISLTFYIVINTYANQVIAPIEFLVQAFQRILPLTVGVQWCEEFFEAVEGETEQPRPVSLDRKCYGMEFRNVTFRYPGAPDASSPALSNLTCEMPEGEITVLCGPSGCGKSTVLKHLSGALEPSEGQVRIGEVDLATVDRKSLSQVVALVSQKISLLSMSVLENVELLAPRASHEELRGSLRVARVLQELEQMQQEIPVTVKDPAQSPAGRFLGFLFGLPQKEVQLLECRQGVDRKVGPSGGLSGGQQQRVSVGFALLTHCPVMLFDEPTSGLDKSSENELVETIAALADGSRTIVVVSHSLPPYFTLPSDRVRFVFLKEGKVLAQGRRRELLKTCPEFRDLARENVRHVLSMAKDELELLIV